MSSIADISVPSAGTSFSSSLSTGTTEEVMGKEDFLTLLVTQLENQDPMNPDDPTEFTAQLAQFSSLEQLFNMNKAMEEMTLIQKQSDQFSTMNLLDKSVSYVDSQFSFSDSPVSVGYELDGNAGSLSMGILDDAGAPIATLHPTDLSKGKHFIEWDGIKDNGDIAAPGTYKIVLQASAGTDEADIVVSPLIQSQVTGVDFSNETGEAIVYTLAGAEIGISSILTVQKDQDKLEPTSSTSQDESNSTTSSTETSDTARIAASTVFTESAPRDDDQIAQDQLRHFLAGTN